MSATTFRETSIRILFQATRSESYQATVFEFSNLKFLFYLITILPSARTRHDIPGPGVGKIGVNGPCDSPA